MRLWTLHPRYLDARGLVALWREALLAQAVLAGMTCSYVRHPQLRRFREAPAPSAAIGAYLRAVHAEAVHRGYRFDAGKIAASGAVERMTATQGQLDFEWGRLRAKLSQRSPAWLAAIAPHAPLEPHPLFRIVPGPVADWEVVPPLAP